jgi:hypothetical protein
MLPTKTESGLQNEDEFTDAASEDASTWTSLECATCDAMTRVTTSELIPGNTISCRQCWQPLTVPHSDSEAQGLGEARQIVARRVAKQDSDDTQHDSETVSDVERLAKTKRSRRHALEVRTQIASSSKDSSSAPNESDLSGESAASPNDAEPSDQVEPIDAAEVAQIQIETEPEEADAQGWSLVKRGLERRRDDFAGAIVSVVVHMLLWLMLAAIVMQFKDPWGQSAFNLSFSEQPADLDSTAIEQAQRAEDALQDDAFVPMQNVRVDHLVAGVKGSGAQAAGKTDFVMPTSSDDFQFGTADMKWAIESGSGFVGRTPENRKKLALQSGGTAESEDAVELGLKWLAKTQLENGSWDFSTGKGRDVLGRPTVGVGKHEPMAATAMALMCFLGAGYTHQAEKYQDEIQQGLKFLMSKQKRTGDARGRGDMYSHGLVSIALCEAYGMTGDKKLKEPAQTSLDFIEEAQNQIGGWRYQPKQAGDTSIVGWQVMAIASGRMAGLETKRIVTSRAVKFLDVVFNKKNGLYGYTSATKSSYGANTAIGTLCRMYLHFGFDRDAMNKSVAETAKYNPTGNDLYARYYAIQVLHHVGGPVWEKWNPKCRDHLVDRQTKSGTNKGSWSPASKWASRGGRRHYETCFSIMCLEVYYRHMPIYKRAAFQ